MNRALRLRLPPQRRLLGVRTLSSVNLDPVNKNSVLSKTPTSASHFNQNLQHFQKLRRKPQITPEHDLPKYLDGTLTRLAEAYKFITPKSRFHYSLKRCQTLYKLHPGCFLLRDILQYEKVNDQLIDYLFENYWNSPSVRTYILNDMLGLLVQNDNTTFRWAVLMLEKHRATGKNMANKRKRLEKYIHTPAEVDSMDLSEFPSYLVSQAAKSGLPLVAATTALALKEKGFEVDSASISQVLESLMVEDSSKFVYHSYTIFKVLDAFSYKVDEELAASLVKFMLSDNTTWYAEVLLAKVQIVDPKDLLVPVLCELVQKHLEAYNLRPALRLWHALPDSKFNNISLIAALIEKSVSSDVDTIIASLPQEVLEKEEIKSSLLRFYAKNHRTKEFELLVRMLQLPVDRLTISVLFECFLLQNNETAAENLLQSILKSYNGISTDDMDAIVNKLLRQQNLSSAFAILKRSSVNVGKQAYVSVLKYLLLSPECVVSESEKQEFLRNLVKRFRSLSPEDTALQEMTVVLMQFLNKINPRLSRKFYDSFAYGTNEKFDLFTFVPADGIEQFVEFSSTNRIVCLQLVGKLAIKLKDIPLIQWTIESMRLAGMTLCDSVSFFAELDEKLMAEVVKPELLQQIKEEDAKRVK